MFGAALLAACSGGDGSTSGLSVGDLTSTSQTTAPATTSTSGTPTSGTSGTGAASDSTTAAPTTGNGTTTGPGTATATTDASGSTQPAGTGTTDASTTAGPACGDGVVDVGEACDGAELGGMTCMSLGFTQGVLACDDACQLDTSGCSGMPACADALVPPGGPVCPPECTGGCDMNTGTCAIDCDGNVCNDKTVTCPDNWACTVSCVGTVSCAGATIQCPAQYACDVTCDGTAACEPATFNCGDGPCHVFCTGTVPCSGSTFNCGLGDSQIACGQVTNVDPLPALVPEPMSACACEVVGC